MTSEEHRMLGLEANNPLGYLAALGTLVVLNPLIENPKIWWERYQSSLIPILKTKNPMEKIEISEIISEELGKGVSEKRFDPPLKKKAKLSHISPESFRRICRQRVDKKTEETFAAYGIDIPSEDNEKFDRTEFDFLHTGQQGFLKAARNLSEEVSPEKIERSLFEEWDYEDDGDGNRRTRWDPWDLTGTKGAYIGPNPATREKKTVHGSNRLAIEALRLYPVVPTESGGQTTGFLDIDGEKYFQYPVWRDPIGLKAVKSLLRNQEVYRERLNLDRLDRAGVIDILRAKKTEVRAGGQRYYSFFWARPA